MRRGLVMAVVGLLLLGGLGVAVAQLGGADDKALDLEVPTSSTITTPPAPETKPDTTVVSEPSTSTTPTRTPAPAPASTRPVSSAPATQPPGSAAGSPPPNLASPTQPSNPFQPAPDPYQPESKLVQPRPGMENVHKTGWERVEILGESRVRVHFVSGVEPCTVLDHVDVEYRPAEIVITLYEGSDPAAKETACIMIALYKAVDVELGQPIGGRRFIDGAE
jgi:hypothetical protein